MSRLVAMLSTWLRRRGLGSLRESASAKMASSGSSGHLIEWRGIRGGVGGDGGGVVLVV